MSSILLFFSVNLYLFKPVSVASTFTSPFSTKCRWKSAVPGVHVYELILSSRQFLCCCQSPKYRPVFCCLEWKLTRWGEHINRSELLMKLGFKHFNFWVSSWVGLLKNDSISEEWDESHIEAQMLVWFSRTGSHLFVTDGRIVRNSLALGRIRQCRRDPILLSTLHPSAS